MPAEEEDEEAEAACVGEPLRAVGPLNTSRCATPSALPFLV
jgi:hypothetical protein